LSRRDRNGEAFFITSNSERRLPEPFLRRCVYHHIRFDDALAVGAYPELLDQDLSKLPYLGVLLKDHQDIEELGSKEGF